MRERYAYRCLPPYRGVAHVVVAGATRAITYNGQCWQIQIEAEALPVRLLGRPGPASGRRITLGHWAPEGGLDVSGVRHVTPTEARHITTELVTLLAAGPLPCPLADPYELWLLDRDGLPLALLNSQRAAPAEVPYTTQWQAFGGEHGSTEMALAHALEHSVKRASNGATQWFLRHPDGRGSGGSGRHLARECEGRTLPASAFPVLTVRETGWDDESTRVLPAYLKRLAPRLLMLPLEDATRAELEQAALDQPEELWTFHQLYPRALNPTAWTAAFVGRQIERATCER